MTRIGANPPRAPKRFYADAAVVEEDGIFRLRLDGRSAKTRSGNLLEISSPTLAEAIASEWRGQGDEIDFAAMPMTRYVMTAIDLGARDLQAWRDGLLSFLASDLVCYRALEPQALVARQAAAWDPLLAFADRALGLRLNVCAGVSFIEQPPEAAATARRFIETETPIRLLALKSAAEISGSAVIALCLRENAFPADDLFAASRVDEDFQATRWGLDFEAEQRAKRLKTEFEDAARLLRLA